MALLNKSIKTKILNKIFKKFKIDPVEFAYNRIGILNWENDDLSGETFFVKEILLKQLDQNKNLIFFDIGANVGSYTEKLLTAFKKADVHAFEPLPSCFTKLQNLKKSNSERLIINNLCVSNEIGKISINTYSSDLESEHASVYVDVLTTIHKSNQIQSITALTTTIDKYCEEHEIKSINLLKIDTEGHEYNVLLGAKKMLEDDRISIIQFEFNEMNVISRTYFKDFYDLLNSNFDLYRLNKNSLIPVKKYNTFLEVFKFQNFIAINKNHIDISGTKLALLYKPQ